MSDNMIGYISSRPFWHGTYLPQRLQNVAVKYYCDSNDLNLKWSLPESSKEISYPVLEQMIRDLSNSEFNGIVFASFLQLPCKVLLRHLRKIVNLGGSCHSAIENSAIYNLNDVRNLSDTLIAAELSSRWEKSFDAVKLISTTDSY